MPAMNEAAQVGKKQEILDKIYNVDAAETPFLSTLPIGKVPLQMLASWQAEKYPEVASTGTLDGTPATGEDKVDRKLLEGYCHLFRRDWGVTKLADLTSIAGIKKEAAHQLAAAIKLHRIMIEQQFCSIDDCAVEDGSTPFTTRGAGLWISDEAQTTKPVPESIRPAAACIYDSGTLSSLTEAIFKALMKAAYTARKTAVDLDGFCGTDLKSAIDEWTNVFDGTTDQPRTMYAGRAHNEYEEKVDFLKFSFGNVRLHMTPYLFRDTATGAESTQTPLGGLFIDRNMWDVGWMEKPNNNNLPSDGSGKKGYVDAVALLRCKNPRGQIKIYPTG